MLVIYGCMSAKLVALLCHCFADVTLVYVLDIHYYNQK